MTEWLNGGMAVRHAEWAQASARNGMEIHLETASSEILN